MCYKYFPIEFSSYGDYVEYLKDLCARLPYKPKIKFSIIGVEGYEVCKLLPELITLMFFNEDADIKPYLRPMSSMTEEEAKELSILYGLKDILSIKIRDEYIEVVVDDGVSSTETRTIWYEEIISSIEIFDWLNKHHFDYRGLIEKGLALEAPEGMYE